MSEATVDVSSEHVCHGPYGCLLELADVALQGVHVDGAQLGPVNVVHGVDEVHELSEVSAIRTGRVRGRGRIEQENMKEECMEQSIYIDR